MKRLLAGLFVWVVMAWLSSAQAADTYKPVQGDIIFQSWPHGRLTDAIETATHSPFSHCGVVILNQDGSVNVMEAVSPVAKITPLKIWVERGRGHGFAVYRLVPDYETRIPAFVNAALSFRNYPYNVHYSFDESGIYCSGLVFKAFQKATGGELGAVRRLGDLDWKPIEKFIREIEGGTLPLNRQMITPKDLSEAKQLRLVFRTGI